MPRHNQLLWELGWFLNNPDPVTVAQMGLRVLKSEKRPINNTSRRDMANLVRKAQATALCRFLGGEGSAAHKRFKRAKIELTDLNRRLEAMQLLCSYGRWDPSMSPNCTAMDHACKRLATEEFSEDFENGHRGRRTVKVKREEGWDEDHEEQHPRKRRQSLEPRTQRPRVIRKSARLHKKDAVPRDEEQADEPIINYADALALANYKGDSDSEKHESHGSWEMEDLAQRNLNSTDAGIESDIESVPGYEFLGGDRVVEMFRRYVWRTDPELAAKIEDPSYQMPLEMI